MVLPLSSNRPSELPLARSNSDQLRSGAPSIWPMGHRAAPQRRSSLPPQVGKPRAARVAALRNQTPEPRTVVIRACRRYQVTQLDEQAKCWPHIIRQIGPLESVLGCPNPTFQDSATPGASAHGQKRHRGRPSSAHQDRGRRNGRLRKYGNAAREGPDASQRRLRDRSRREWSWSNEAPNAATRVDLEPPIPVCECHLHADVLNRVGGSCSRWRHKAGQHDQNGRLHHPAAPPP